MSDIFELAKSEQVEDLNAQTPYSSKQWNFINDINGTVYTNSQQSLVQFDLSSIYNSGYFIDCSQMYLTFPMVYTAAYVNSAANAGQGVLVPPTANRGNEFLITPKSGSWNLIQSLEVVVNGKSVIQQQMQTNLHTNFKMLSQMSADDLKCFGNVLGMYPDDVQSYMYNNTNVNLGVVGGNGLNNNAIFPITNVGVAGVANLDQQNAFGNYNAEGTVYNTALQRRSQRISNNLTTPANGISGTLLMQQNFQNEFRPYFMISNGYMCWVDYAIIRLCDICDFFHSCPLTQNFDGLLRIYVNTGALQIGLSQAQTANMYMTAANSSFSNTCPFTINQIPVGNLPAAVTGLAVSCNIARSTVQQNFFGANLSLSGVASSMNSCRCYFPMIKMKPDVALRYINENRAKKLVYTNILSNYYSNINTTFNQLVQSGVRNIRGVLIIPFLSPTVNGVLAGGANLPAGIIPFSPISSPFDTAPNTTPVSITQLNVAVGGLNVSMNYYNYTYENFVQQVTLYDKINASDMGLSCGLISQFMWENGYRYYYFDCSRGTEGEQNTPRNVTVNFVNNTLAILECYIFTEYWDESVIDVSTGRVV